MYDFYVIVEKATGIEMVRSYDLKEIKEIYKGYDKAYFTLLDGKGNILRR